MSMMLTKGSDYALLLLSDLASRSASELHSIRAMAERNHLPERFTANVVSKLIRAGILTSRRGSQGGVQLSRPGSEISFLEVVEAVEGPVVFMDCQRASQLCHHELGCSMRSLWGRIQGRLVDSLRQATIGDVVEGREESDVLQVLG
jgi:Rrf2 family protein